MRGAAAAEYLILIGIIALSLCTVQHLFRPDAMLLAFTRVSVDEGGPPPDGQFGRGVSGGGTNEGKASGNHQRGHGRDGESD